MIQTAAASGSFFISKGIPMKEKIVIKQIILDGKKVICEIHYKKVKNLTARIKHDGKVYVSAGRKVTGKEIEMFLTSNSEKILSALKKCEILNETPLHEYFSREEIVDEIMELCKTVYPIFRDYCKEFPKVRFRKMVSRWGVCKPLGNTLTFNTNLMFAPYECVRYVVLHEFVHFVHPDHSAKFYAELEKYCPEWRECRKKLSEIPIRKI